MHQPSIQTELRKLGWLFIFGYFSVAVALTGTFMYLNHVYHVRLANSYALSSRHSLLIRDLRQSVSSLAPAVNAGFLSVAIRDPNRELVVGIPNNSAIRTQRPLLTFTIIETINSNISGANQGKIVDLEFVYSILTPIALSSILALLLFFLAWFLFERAKKVVTERHTFVVRQREIQAAQVIAQQVAHDIRSPLSALNLLVTKLDYVAKEDQLVFKKVAQRITEIANDLLEKQKLPGPSNTQRSLSRSSTDRRSMASLASKPTVIANVLEDICEEKRIFFESRKDLVLKLDVADQGEAQASIDPKEFFRVLSNLINNAAEAIEEAGTITVALRPAIKEIAVIIMDDGKGIPDEILAQLGSKRVSSGKEGTESGSGLGVLHAKKAVEAMGGKLSIQSRIGIGTMITLTFPKITTT